MEVRVQSEDFELATELAAIRNNRVEIGAIASFIGTVRDIPLLIEHYPSMSLRVLKTLRSQAIKRFDLVDARIIHRFGNLRPGEQIVLVLSASRHRKAALLSVDFIMDTLKSTAPFWKQEQGVWIKQNRKDLDAAEAWNANAQ